jgi:hypothetical protein
MGKRNNNRLAERVWSFLINHDDAMTTTSIHKHLTNVYGVRDIPKQQTLTQVLLQSRMFKRVGWFNESTNQTHPFTGSMSALNRATGIPSTNLVCILEARTMEEVCKPYLDPTASPLRRLDRMPAFVRRHVETLRGESQ